MDENTIFVSAITPAAKYMLVAYKLQSRGNTEIIIKARGKAIGRAFDVAELFLRDIGDWEYGEITPGTESKSITERHIKSAVGEWTSVTVDPYERKVSTIEIKLNKK